MDAALLKLVGWKVLVSSDNENFMANCTEYTDKGRNYEKNRNFCTKNFRNLSTWMVTFKLQNESNEQWMTINIKHWG